MEGWIKVYRKVQDHWIWKSDKRFKWWIDILLTVNHSDSKVLIKGKLIECKRGQSVLSLESWGKRWGITKKAVKDFFTLLQKDSMLLYESVQITTRITVCNYDEYQCVVNAPETQSKRTINAPETDTAPKQERVINKKNDKNENKINYAEFVSLTEIEYRKLVDEHNEKNTKVLISILNNYKGANGKKYKSDYLAILNWVVDRARKDGKYEEKLKLPG